jgi:peptide/nickel transport system substrate-binding protein
VVANDAETLDPRYATDAVGLRTTRLVHAGLVHLDPATLEPRPYVAASWDWLDYDTLRVTLRSDARFHSGAPVTPRDVVATLHAFASPKVGSRHARVVEAIAEATEDGPRAVRIRLAHPHATLLTDLELPILRADEAESPPDPTGQLDGLGPYRVTEWERGAVHLTPSATGVLPAAHHDVVIRTVHDENARALRLIAGRTDVALNQISPTLLPALTEQGLHLADRPGANLTYMVVRHEGGPLALPWARRAVSLAIDRAMLTQALFAGHAHPAGGLIAPANWAHAAGLPPLPFDPVAARAALDMAGYTDPPGAAPRFRVTLLTSTDRLRVSVGRVIAQELADVGIEVEVIPLELGTMLARLEAGDFDLATLQLPEMSEPHVLRHFLHSAFVPPSGANRGRVRDAELDSLLEAGGRTLGTEARRAIYARVEAQNLEQMHLIPLWYEDQVAVVSERARAFVPSAEGRWLGVAEVR